MNLRHAKPAAILLAGAAGISLAAPVAAQSTQAVNSHTELSEDASPSEDGIIVVTARRRAERITDVPISVTALSGEELVRGGTLEITEIADEVPNLTLEVSRGTNTTLTAFIRGVGQQDPVAGFEAGVGLYVDDVYLNRPQGAVLDVYDVERIEVLRGPQGTLYGRNTIGGAIKYVTARLPDETQMKVRGAYGSYDQADLIVSASTPLSDNFRLGVSGARLSRGGYGDNLELGTENYNKDVWAGRGTLEFDSGPLFVRLSGDYVKDNSEARQGGRLLPGTFSGAPVLENPYDTRAGLNVTDQEVEAYGGALQIAYELSDTLTVKSITGYREDASTSPIDFDSLPAADLDVPAIYENEQFSQELQLLVEGDRLSGVLGAYYLDADAYTAFDVALFTTGDLLYLLNPAVDLRGLNAQTLGDVKTETYSVFGDFTYDFTDWLSLSLGGRYTWDNRDSRILRTTFIGGYSDLFDGDGIPIAVTSDFEGEAKYKEFTPRASLAFKPSIDHTLYLSYSKGFKGGGFDPRGQTSAAPDFDGNGTVSYDEQYRFLNFQPETVDSYEAGWKASLLDNRLNIALAGFVGKYEDVQIPGSIGFDSNGDGVNDSFIGVTTNAASADINGIEFEGNALVGRDFAGSGSRASFNWSVGYLDAGFNEYVDAFGNDVADERVIQNTPEFTAHAGFAVGVAMAGGIVDFLSSVSMRSETSQFELAGPLDQQAYEIVDLGVVYTADSDRFAIGLHAKNVFDQRYIVSGYDFVTGTVLGLEGNLTAFNGDPRRVFVTGEVKF